jgi:magnesium-transporting ATPase (P-type)
LLAQFTHFFALMLWAAAVLAFVAGMPQLAIAIVVVIIVNGVFAFVQEQRAERAARREPMAAAERLLADRPRHAAQTATRLRPFARRALMIARPLAVFMRTRNPCVFLRWAVDGWKVRFIADVPG